MIKALARRMSAVVGANAHGRVRPTLAYLRQSRPHVVTAQQIWRLQRALAAQPSWRLKAALTGLLLLEAFLAYILLVHFINGLTINPIDSSQPPNDSGLAFTTIVAIPAFLLVVWAQYRTTRETEQRRVIEQQRRARQGASDLTRAYGLLHLQPSAPLYIAQAAYTAAMKHAHPDVDGGDAITATELNWAIATIRDHVGTREIMGR